MSQAMKPERRQVGSIWGRRPRSWAGMGSGQVREAGVPGREPRLILKAAGRSYMCRNVCTRVCGGVECV